jgi:hypothetical protein
MFPTFLCIFAGSAHTEINKQDVYNTCVYYTFNSIAFFIYPNIYPESYARKGHTAKLAHFKHIRDMTQALSYLTNLTNFRHDVT